MGLVHSRHFAEEWFGSARVFLWGGKIIDRCRRWAARLEKKSFLMWQREVEGCLFVCLFGFACCLNPRRPKTFLIYQRKFPSALEMFQSEHFPNQNWPDLYFKLMKFSFFFRNAAASFQHPTRHCVNVSQQHSRELRHSLPARWGALGWEGWAGGEGRSHRPVGKRAVLPRQQARCCLR